MNTQQAIETNPAQLLRAISSRGKFKGYLKASAPSISKDPEGWTAWQALVSNIAPAMVSTYSLILASTEQKKAFEQLDVLVQASGLKTALNACEPAFRWNLWAHRYDREKAQQLLQDAYNKYDGGELSCL